MAEEKDYTQKQRDYAKQQMDEQIVIGCFIAFILTLIIMIPITNYQDKSANKQTITHQLVNLTPHERNGLDSIFKDYKYYTISYHQKNQTKHATVDDSNLIQDTPQQKAQHIKITTNGHHKVTKAVLVK